MRKKELISPTRRPQVIIFAGLLHSFMYFDKIMAHQEQIVATKKAVEICFKLEPRRSIWRPTTVTGSEYISATIELS